MHEFVSPCDLLALDSERVLSPCADDEQKRKYGRDREPVNDPRPLLGSAREKRKPADHAEEREQPERPRLADRIDQGPIKTVDRRPLALITQKTAEQIDHRPIARIGLGRRTGEAQ